MRKLNEGNKETGLTILRNKPKKYLQQTNRKRSETEFSFLNPFLSVGFHLGPFL